MCKIVVPLSFRLWLLMLTALVWGCGSETAPAPSNAGPGEGKQNLAAVPKRPVKSDKSNKAKAPASSYQENAEGQYVIQRENDADSVADDDGEITSEEPGSVPDDVAKWSPDHLRKAARNRDDRLKAAIEHQNTNSPNDPKVALLLKELLSIITDTGKEVPSGKDGENNVRDKKQRAEERIKAKQRKLRELQQASSEDGGASLITADDLAAARLGGLFFKSLGDTDRDRGPADGFVKMIVGGLAQNGTSQAYETLAGLLSSEIKTTVDEQTLAEWVLLAAVENTDGEDHPADVLLNQILTSSLELSAEKDRELQQQTIGILSEIAASVMDQLLGIPTESDSKQGEDGESDDVGSGKDGENNVRDKKQRAKQRAEERIKAKQRKLRELQQASSEDGGASLITADDLAAARLGGLFFKSLGGSGRGSARLQKDEPRVMDAAAASQAIRFLWKRDLLQLVEARTRNVKDFADAEAGILLLAGSLPVPLIRRATYDLLQRRWLRGAGPLRYHQLYSSVVRDPGLLIVLKLTPRVQLQETSKDVRIDQQRRAAASQTNREIQAKASWLTTSANLIRALNERMFVAAQAADSSESDLSLFPVKIPQEAQIKAEYHLSWPDDVQDRIGDRDPGPLVIHYLRMEIVGSAAAKKSFLYYKSRLKRGTRHHQFLGYQWLDKLTKIPQTGHRRSIDIVLTHLGEDLLDDQYGNGSGGGASLRRRPRSGDVQDKNRFSIDFLTIEIPDPRPPRTAAR